MENDDDFKCNGIAFECVFYKPEGKTGTHTHTWTNICFLVVDGTTILKEIVINDEKKYGVIRKKQNNKQCQDSQ